MKKIILFLGLFLFLVSFKAMATAVNNTDITVQYGNVGIGTIGANGPAGTYQTIYTAPTSGNNFTKLTALIATNYDTTSAHFVNCTIANGSNIPGIEYIANVGIGTSTTNMLATVSGQPIDQWGNTFHYLPAGYTVNCTYNTAMAAGAKIGIDAQAGEF